MPEKKEICEHVCSGNCRREGCNCLCGEYHEQQNVYPDDFISEKEQEIDEEEVFDLFNLPKPETWIPVLTGAWFDKNIIRL